MMNRPLEGIRVLDLTWVYAGPHGTLLLKDMGADVVKLEGPPYGDYTRFFPPFKNNSSGYFYMLNRGKKSIAVNLKKDRGKDLFLELCKHFDVVVENFVAGTMEHLGLGYEKIKEVNPGIIYAAIHGFGSWGQYSYLPCVDPVAQAMGGLMSLTGLPGGSPLKTGPAVADALAGTYMSHGILAAIIARNRTGKGQRLEVSMMDCVFAALEESVIRASMTGDALPLRGNTDPLGAPWDAFLTKDDKWVMVCSFGGKNFYKIYTEIGRSDLAEQYKGDDMDAIDRRSKNLPMLNAAFAKWAKTKTSDEVMSFMYERNIPSGVVKDITELLEDPHLIARDMVIDIDHPILGKVKINNMPIKFSDSQAGLKPGDNPMEPKLGEDTQKILTDLLGMDSPEITALREQGVIWA
ncbi:MAG: CoA transferase [Thermodesulfobacteriota bacterium]|nr:CoA transferase [Thermodesulfobacteriota bacterium]